MGKTERIISLYKAYAKYADILEYFPAIISYKYTKNIAIYREDITIAWCSGPPAGRQKNYFCADLAEQLNMYTTRLP